MFKKPFTLGLIFLTCAISGVAQTEKDRRVVAVSGQAEVMVVPDEVVFKLESENVNLDVIKAKAETDTDVKKIVAVTRNYKIDPQNIQTGYIRISERYGEYVTGKPRDFKGYAVTQNTTILLKNIDRFESLLADLVKAGVSDLSGVTFRSSQMRTYMDQARALAMKAAKEKAEALAKELGLRVIKAYTVIEDDQRNPIVPMYRQANSAGQEGGGFALGEIVVRTGVRVIFEVQ